jgi:hypothetical protein
MSFSATIHSFRIRFRPFSISPPGGVQKGSVIAKRSSSMIDANGKRRNASDEIGWRREQTILEGCALIWRRATQAD